MINMDQFFGCCFRLVLLVILKMAQTVVMYLYIIRRRKRKAIKAKKKVFSKHIMEGTT